MDVREQLRLHRRNRLRGSTVRFYEDNDNVVNTWVGPVNTQLYGTGLQTLCHQTSDNIERLQTTMSKTDPCFEYGIKHWHTETRPKSSMSFNEGSVDFKGRWKDANVMFTDTETIKNIATPMNDNESLSSYSETPLPPNKFCYLCTTMEEHKRHMHLQKVPKRPSTGKTRIKYIAPMPTLKKKEEVEVDTTLYERLYKVDVYTGESGINANVHITIKGSRDELPKTQLKKGRGSMNFIFMRETKETFYLKAPFLGELEIATIEHDGLQQTHKWYLEKIIITDVKSEQVWEFECFNWLSLHIKDYRIKRDLFGKKTGKAALEVYNVQIYTGKKAFSGTNATICMTVFGTRGATNKLKFVDHDKTKFEKGQMDSFDVSSKNLGELRRIRVLFKILIALLRISTARSFEIQEMKRTSLGGTVIISQRDNPSQKYYFLYNGWIGKDIGEGVLYRDIPAKKHIPKETEFGQKTKYMIFIKTGDKRYAGTDANVFIQINGEKTMTKKKTLDDEKNNFERGQLDSFQYEDVDVIFFSMKMLMLYFSVKIKRYLQRKEIVEYLKKTKKEAAKMKHTKRKGGKDEVDELEDRMQKLMKKGSKYDDLSDNEDLKGRKGRRTSKSRSKYDDDLSDNEDLKGRKGRRTSKSRSKYDDDSSDEEEELRGRKGRKEKNNKKAQKKKRGKRDSSSSSDSSDSEEEYKSKSKDKKNQRRMSDNIELKVPLYEEYVFPCNEWFAKDEGDGLFVRELKVKERTMYYKN
ncbi:unnamed protein product [Mytilus edulis]|uniref:PLAT domain-containing protein n=1 Tax=Mytilus edulis TaxID=6550 RepID=A0A8S3QMU7_MYTED|nr:unnamed protein product [Mytilus edulis]